MTEYRVKWQQCPHVHHETRVLFIEAASPEDARAIARDHIERRHGIEWFSVREITPAPAIPAGAAALAQAEHRDSGKPEAADPTPSNVRNFLDLSTGHLTPTSRGWIEQHLARGPTYDHPDGYGWLVWVPAADDEHPTPPDVLACYAKAREFNCDYLLFDSDAEECPGLDYYPDAEDDEEESVTAAS